MGRYPEATPREKSRFAAAPNGSRASSIPADSPETAATVTPAAGEYLKKSRRLA